jgi:glycosyltransferase involved in cell wall biosynthesis
MASAPEVSVVIPTRNRWSRLSVTLGGALRQEQVEHEVIVIDDCSTDETPHRLAAMTDPRLRVFRHEERRGVAPARNRGIAEARGEWVAFLDDDDFWSPRKLRAQLDVARGADAVLAYGAVAHIGEDGSLIDIEPAPDPARLPTWLLSVNPMPAGCSNVMARTALVRRVGGFDENLFQLADWDLWLRLVEAGRAVACEEVLVGYLRHSQNMLVERQHDVLRELDYLAAKHRAASAAHGVAFNGVLLSRWMALTELRAGRRLVAMRAYLRGALAYRNPRNLLRAMRTLVQPRAVERVELRDGTATVEEWPDEPAWLELYR